MQISCRLTPQHVQFKNPTRAARVHSRGQQFRSVVNVPHPQSCSSTWPAKGLNIVEICGRESALLPIGNIRAKYLPRDTSQASARSCTSEFVVCCPPLENFNVQSEEQGCIAQALSTLPLGRYPHRNLVARSNIVSFMAATIRISFDRPHAGEKTALDGC